MLPRALPELAHVGVAGRELLDRLDVAQPWRGTVDALRNRMGPVVAPPP